jgi:hypothetical protein
LRRNVVVAFFATTDSEENNIIYLPKKRNWLWSKNLSINAKSPLRNLVPIGDTPIHKVRISEKFEKVKVVHRLL